MTSIQELATEYLKHFGKQEIGNGLYNYYVKTRSDFLPGLIDYATTGINDNDTSHKFVYDALEAFRDCDNPDKVVIDTTATKLELLQWFMDDFDRSRIVEEIVSESIEDDRAYTFSLFDAMQQAYNQEAYETLYAVKEYLLNELK